MCEVLGGVFVALPGIDDAADIVLPRGERVAVAWPPFISCRMYDAEICGTAMSEVLPSSPSASPVWLMKPVSVQRLWPEPSDGVEARVFVETSSGECCAEDGVGVSCIAAALPMEASSGRGRENNA